MAVSPQQALDLTQVPGKKVGLVEFKGHESEQTETCFNQVPKGRTWHSYMLQG